MFTNLSTPYYTPSGKTPVGGLGLFIIGGLLAAWLLGIAYTYVVEYIPFIYVNFLATLGFGFALGYVLNRLSTIGRLRSPFKVVVLAAVIALVGLWLHWAFFCAFFLNKHAEDVTLIPAYIYFLTSFPAVFDFAGKILETGHFTIGKSGSAITGWALGGIWAIEALLILGVTVWFARAQSRMPYSEALGRWANQEGLPTPLAHFADPRSAKADLEAGNIALLLHADLPGENAMAFSTIVLHIVENDPDCHFLTLINVVLKVNKKGETEREEDIIVEHLRITPEHCRELRVKFAEPQEASQSLS